MNRTELVKLIEGNQCNVIHYETSRRYKDFIFNQQLDEDCVALDRLPHDTYVLVVSTGINNRPRAGQII
jgi:hypothetical protein